MFLTLLIVTFVVAVVVSFLVVRLFASSIDNILNGSLRTTSVRLG